MHDHMKASSSLSNGGIICRKETCCFHQTQRNLATHTHTHTPRWWTNTAGHLMLMAFDLVVVKIKCVLCWNSQRRFFVIQRYSVFCRAGKIEQQSHLCKCQPLKPLKKNEKHVNEKVKLFKFRGLSVSAMLITSDTVICKISSLSIPPPSKKEIILVG